MTKQYLKKQIRNFVDVYNLKLKTVFENIDSEADEHANDYFQEVFDNSYSPESIDPADVADYAMDKAIEHWDLLNHGRYALLSSWHIALYEAFEQQMRHFLYNELLRNFKITMNHIFSKFGDLKKILIHYGVDLGSVEGLKEIDQLRLVCNVVKHGEGSSAAELRKKRPDIIKKHEDIELLELYGTSLLDEVLNINEETLIEFGTAIERFWDSLPERSYCKEPEKLLLQIDKYVKK